MVTANMRGTVARDNKRAGQIGLSRAEVSPRRRSEALTKKPLINYRRRVGLSPRFLSTPKGARARPSAGTRRRDARPAYCAG
eukprot:290185-Prorocentrum_minimum.AAC.1